jgi:hypothetical protein
MADEPIAIDDVFTDLDSQWNASNVTKPTFIKVNAANEPLRFDLNVGDHLIGRIGTPSFIEQPIGNWKYGNRVYNIEVEIFTLNSRQRLFNLMQEIRRICHKRMHSLTNFQRQQFLNFSEQTSEQVNIWTGTVAIQLVNNAVLLET